MPDRPIAHDVWLWTVGFNLHDTSFFNFQGHLTENFFKSLLYTPHGLTDTLPNYIASWLYGMVGIPLNEFWIYFVHAFLGIISIALIFFVGSTLFNKKVGLLSALLLALLPVEIKVYGSGLVQNHDFLIFLQLLLFLSLFHYRNRQTILASVLFSFMLAINAGTENIMILPFVILLHYFLEYEKEGGFAAATKRFFRYALSRKCLLIWLFPALVLCAHLYIYYRIGESNLGMIGYVLAKWGPGSSKPGFFLMIKDVFRMTYENFFRAYLIAVIIMCFSYFFAKKGRLNMRFVGLILWFLSIFAVNAYFAQGGDPTNFRYSHFFVPLVLLSGYISVYTFERISRLKTSDILKRSLCFFTFSFFAVTFIYNLSSNVKLALDRKIYFNPLKAASFYVRERGGPETTVFQLVPKASKRSMRGEFYFGKSFMEPGEETGIKRELFSFGKHSMDEYKKAYNLKDFDFYVLYHDDEFDEKTKAQIQAFLGSLKKRSLNKVADIERDGELLATIYSQHLFGYEKIDARAADRLWDKKYANLPSLLQNRWCGLAALWGFHHRLD